MTPPRSNQCAADRITAYNAAAAAPCSSSYIRSELSGLTLGPGVYCSGGAMTLSAGALTLDAENDDNAEWIFQMASTLITSPDTSIILTNLARARNVGSSATIAYSSRFIGNIIHSYGPWTCGSRNFIRGGIFYTFGCLNQPGPIRAILFSLLIVISSINFDSLWTLQPSSGSSVYNIADFYSQVSRD